MADVGDFLVATVSGGLFTVGLLGLAIWKWKSLITHWLLKDIEGIKSRHQQELEFKKAQYARELESYRTSLIAQTEAIKAAQDVKKAGALRVVEKRFSAFDGLHRAVSGLGIDFLTLLGRSENDFPTGWLDERYRRLAELDKAFHEAEIFLAQDERRLIWDYRGELTSVISRCSEPNAEDIELTEKQAFMDSVLRLESLVDEMIRDHVHKMQVVV